MSTHRPTIREVALAAGVSSATVSRVINGATTVDRELTRRVQAAVRQTGYVPNAAGRSLRQRRSSQIAVVTPDAENPYFMQLVGEVEKVARSNGYSVLLAHTDDDLEVETEIVSQLVGRQVAGVIAVVVDEERSGIDALLAARIPVVLVDRRLPGAPVDCIATDNVDAGVQAAGHLHQRGYRRPACIAGPRTLGPTEDRMVGFVRGWADHGIDVAVVRGDLHLDSGRSVMHTLLDGGDPDCVYVTNNRMSAGAFEAIRAGEHEVGLLATDDDLWARLVTPTVSVVEQPFRATGRRAAQLLAERIANPDDSPSVTLLRSRVIPRESTAGPRHLSR